MTNKIMKSILCGLMSLAIALPVLAPIVVQAEMGMSSMDGMRKKRYRYRKRTHRVQLGVDVVPWNTDKSNQNLALDLDLLYGYNMGYFEVGPNINFMHKAGSNFSTENMALGLGIWAEGNFIKNTRKKKVIPALGLKVNYVRIGKDNSLLLSPYLAIKLFPASRTGLVLNLGYGYQTPFQELFKKAFMGINLGLNYVHYFHF